MPRRQSEEPSFSTDPFLDVVCNLVGIMIILIIVAGLRVSRAPVRLSDGEPAPDAPAEVAAAAPPTSRVTGIRPTAVAGWLELAPDAPIDAPAPEQPPADLIAQAEELRRQAAAAAQESAELDARAAAVRQQHAVAQTQLRDLAAEIELSEVQVRQVESDAERAAQSVRELADRVAELENQAATLAGQSTVAHVLKHRVTPISRQVADKDELHFRLSGNRVAVVPLESLAEALKFRMERSRDLFFKINRYEGTAGPIDGFLMRYVIEKQQPSAIEELRNGGPFMRIQLTYYELEAGDDVVAETSDEALRPGSRFLTALAAARPDAALTFWVYPDSFELHRQLQEYAHEAGFEVAARPLPVGVPIAGSPHGSRSAAQ